MLLKIIHRTRYHYSQPVFLEPFTVRLRPRSDANQTVRSYNIDFTPIPSGVSHCIGLDGNHNETIWFGGLHENLLIEVHTVVETHHVDPFNFLVTDPAALSLPVKYQPNLETALAHYLRHNNTSPQVDAFAQEIMQAAKYETIKFLMLLAEQIPTRLNYMLREHGDSWTPEETMKHGEGACRDFSVLFIEVCRIAGIAARFVSGYCIGDIASSNHMHAWAEVYLPGAGWRGFDPSRGVTTSDDHVAVAASHNPQDASPTSGNYRGQATSSMEADISIRLMNSVEPS
ncbi:conserved hypothetical protein, Transglutaminase domain protein [Sulfuricella denitrificans skB26]|uniref:Transglutaminase-like domain-containing protein n=1 Tax=Sulfuricella denitrificans (strain DSM 22764 / NBRC 105220 / skB26) TaxID=1163617 RepID=S6B700_SULDS|nr:transglutaminase family protein [Sulfuricella denitrificans]BAN36232.1 conserved hypothetical protein, Transglutaminase domain protein [Sulfuricella denitrificans skB26]